MPTTTRGTKARRSDHLQRRKARKPRIQPCLEILDRFRPRTERRFVTEVVVAVLDVCESPDLEVSLLLTDDREIAKIHHRHLGSRRPTDVLSFLVDGTAEIVVSVECARRRAKHMGHTIRAETALYIIHGILHVCGLDDQHAADRRRMRAAEQQILTSLNLRVTPVDR